MDREVTKTLEELERKLAQLERELTSIGRRGAPEEQTGPESARPQATAFEPPHAQPPHAEPPRPQPPHDRFPRPEPPHAEPPRPQAPERPLGGRLVDEAAEGGLVGGEDPWAHPAGAGLRHEPPPGVGWPTHEHPHLDPGMPSVEEPGETPASERGTAGDFAIERDWSVGVRETAFGEIPPHAGEVLRRDAQPGAGVGMSGPSAPLGKTVEVAALEAFRDKLSRTMDELIEEYNELLSLRPSVPPRFDD